MSSLATGQAPPATPGEKAARVAVVVLMSLAVMMLMFGVGFFIADQQNDDSAPVASTQASPGGNGQPAAAASGDSVGAAILDEILGILRSQHIDKDSIDIGALREAAIDGVIKSLNDPHTSYLSPQDLKAGSLDLSSTYQGIGASVTDRGGVVQIVAPFRDSPAEKAGIKAGDIILEVDGDKTDGWSDQEAVQRIRGPKGTTVSLKVQHADNTTADVKVVRGEIDIESVFVEPRLEVIPGESKKDLVDRDGKVASEIAYVHISQFHDKTLGELRTKLRNVEAQYKGLIIDVRANPGGLLSATVEVADEFLNSGVVLSEVNAAKRTQSYSARAGGLATRIPIVVIQDRTSASGAEVLAAALRDNNRAKVIGTRSFGKGTVNQLMPLRKCGDPAACGALYVSVGRWLSPKGEQIEGVGVVPDVEVDLTGEEYLEKGDLQVFAAIDILRGK